MMQRLDNKTLTDIYGGAISGTVVQYLLKGVELFINVGINLGSSLRRITSHKMCSI